MTSHTAHLESRGLIRIKGADWRGFLQGLITQDVLARGGERAQYGALLTPQGRMLYDALIFDQEDSAVLDVALASRDAFVTKLLLYRLRAKLEISAISGQVFAAWGESQPPADIDWRRDPRLSVLGWRGFVLETRMLAADGPEADYDRHRLALGVADPAKDGVEADYPIELNLDLLGGIDFTKGCFIGQETTSRMHRRGVAKNRLAPIVFDGPPPAFGAQILAGDKRAGEVRSGEIGRALAWLRTDRAAGAPLSVEGRPVSVDLPPWLRRLFQVAVEEAPQS